MPIEVLLGARRDVEGGKRRPTVIVLVLDHYFYPDGKNKVVTFIQQIFHHIGPVA